MSDFKDPYLSEKITLASLLRYTIYIPINQRHYAWDPEKDVFTFLKDALDSMESGYKYSIGDFITFTSLLVTFVFDGQCRAITAILFLTACLHHIDKFSKTEEERELISDIKKLIFIDCDPWASVPDEVKRQKKEHNWKNYPRVKSHYEDDFIQLGNIMNLTDTIDYDSPLYKAYHVCRKFIRDMPIGIKEFTGFILHNTVAIEKKAATSEQAAGLMDRANNRGQRMQPYENMRNLFITAFYDKSTEISEHMEELNKVEHVWEMASLLFNKEVVLLPKNYLNNTLKKVVKNKELITQFLAYADASAKLYKKLELTYVGRRYPDLMWNVVVPIHVYQHKVDIDDELLYSIGKRMLQRGCLEANRIGSRTPWINAAHATIHDGKPFVLPDIVEGSFETLLPCIEPINRPMNKDTAGLMLWIIYRQCQPRGISTLQNGLDVEHISGKKCSDGVTNKEHLGNLTLFEGLNDPIVKDFRGNRSLGKLPYAEKREMYNKSAIKMTNILADKYESFNDHSISERGRAMLREILT